METSVNPATPGAAISQIQPQFENLKHHHLKVDDTNNFRGSKKRNNSHTSANTTFPAHHNNISGHGAVGNVNMERTHTDVDNMLNTVSRSTTLRDHLREQLNFEVTDRTDHTIGLHLIDLVNEEGYLTENIETVAAQLVEQVMERWTRRPTPSTPADAPEPSTAPQDVAANLSRWLDGIVARTFRHALLEEFAEAAEIPVINALTDLLHPCQVMADFQTVAEYGPLESATLAYVGDGNNMANSLMLGAAVLGLTLRVGTPESHRPPASLRERARLLSAKSGARISWSEDPSEAVRAADFVYTDVWASMGQEGERESRRAIFQPYQLNADLMRGAPDARVMHCLPAHRGEEITDEVLDGSRSIVFEQAENRLHAQKAILEHLLLRKA